MEKKNIITILVIAVLIIATIAIALIFYLKVPSKNQTPEQNNNISNGVLENAPKEKECPRFCEINDVLCGSDGKDYCNECQAKAAKTTIAHAGSCDVGGKPKPIIQNIGGSTDSHGCVLAAGYAWCSVKNKCLRPWEEKCQ